jgi:single-strand DNA-binding protein
MNNQWVGWGNLTRDPELRYFESGTNVCNTGLAINNRWTDKNGKEQESTDFFDLSIWGKMGENVAESCSSGDRVLVIGVVKIRRVEDESGKTRQFTEINVTEIGPTLRWATTGQTKNPRNVSSVDKVPIEKVPVEEESVEAPF